MVVIKREITVYSYGDANSKKTWSNVPYFLTKTFENKGYIVNKVNTQPNKIISRIWNALVLRVIKIFIKDSTYTYDRTPFYRSYVKRLMKKTVNKYNNTDIFISISFSYHPKEFTSRKVFMFCDWTYDYYFEHFKKRTPDFFERQEITNQHELQKSVDGMFVLFPDVAKYVSQQAFCKNVYYLGNVINSEKYEMTSDTLVRKNKNKNIVFIGSIKYIEGLKVLVETIENLSKKYSDIRLDVIGITEKQFNFDENTNIHFWGYLNKSFDEDNKTYYDIVNNARVFVNTTPEWASFSAILDVMYHYTPIITSRYRSFEQTFGREINFGSYCENDKMQLENKIEEVIKMDSSQYESICKNARKAVSPFSWDKYVDKMISKIDKNM